SCRRLKYELQRQLHDPRILRRQDFSEVLIVDCSDRNSRTVAICQVECFNACFDANILLKSEDSRQSCVDAPKARPGKGGPPRIPERARRRLREGSRIEPAAWIRVVTKRIGKQPIRALRTAICSRQLAVDTCCRCHETARQYAITGGQPPIRGNRIQCLIGEV